MVSRLVMTRFRCCQWFRINYGNSCSGNWCLSHTIWNSCRNVGVFGPFSFIFSMTCWPNTSGQVSWAAPSHWCLLEGKYVHMMGYDVKLSVELVFDYGPGLACGCIDVNNVFERREFSLCLRPARVQLYRGLFFWSQIQLSVAYIHRLIFPDIRSNARYLRLMYNSHVNVQLTIDHYSLAYAINFLMRYACFVQSSFRQEELDSFLFSFLMSAWFRCPLRQANHSRRTVILTTIEDISWCPYLRQVSMDPYNL